MSAKPAQFRSARPAGVSLMNNLTFNELGGTRVPGPTGGKVADLPFLEPAERELLRKEIHAGLKFEGAVVGIKGIRNQSALGDFTLELQWNFESSKPMRLLDDDFRSPYDAILEDEIRALYLEYDRLCENEFLKINKELRPSFENGWKTYRDLRPLYLKAGFTDPPTEVNKINPKATFLGLRIVGGVHEEFEKILKAVELKLKTPGPQDLERSYNFEIAGFVPRPISDHKSSLSNHAIGKAIDIDAKHNPQFSHDEAVKIDRVLQWLKLQKSKGAWWLRSYNLTGPHPFSRSLSLATNMDGSLRHFQEMEENSAWIQCLLREMYPMRQQLKNEAQQAAKYLKPVHNSKSDKLTANSSDEAAEDAVETYENVERLISALAKATPSVKPEQAMKIGILTLPPKLFAAMAEAGAQSGLEYEGKKDAMHFEVPSKRSRSSRKHR
jgi:hypothetical protein